MSSTPHTTWRTGILLVFFVLASTIVTAQLRHPRIQEMERGGPASGNYYCVPTFLFGTQNDDYVDGVSLGSISQLGTGGNPGPDHSDYFFAGDNTVTRLMPNTEYDLVVTSGPHADMYYAWVDFNGNGDFDAPELLGSEQSGGQFEQVTITFTVPGNAQIGYTGLRVMCLDIFTPTPDPCGAYELGETEDYAVLIDDGAPCTPLFSEGTSEGDYFEGVDLEDMHDGVGTTGSPAYTPPRQHVHLESGTTHDINFTTGAFDADRYKAWADWDQDGQWNETDEVIGEYLSTSNFTPHTWTFTVPENAWGWVRLRLKCGDENTLDPCSDYTYGETRDYMIVIDHPSMPCLTYNFIGATNGQGMGQVDVNGSTVFTPAALPNHFITGTDPVVHVLPGGVLNVSVTGNSANVGNLVVGYMDLNNDNDFDDANETGPYTTGTVANEVMDFTLNVPLGTTPSGHFLRVTSYGEGFEFANGCYDPSEGQVMDIMFFVDGDGTPCIPGSVNWTTGGDIIDGVQLGTIDNTGTGASYGPPYTDFTSLSTDLVSGQDYDLILTTGPSTPSNYHAWIDLNNDGDFTDPNELIGSVTSTVPNGQVVIPFAVPNGTPLGSKRMRVRCTWIAGAEPCADTDYGETEDYTVNITTSTGLATHDPQSWSALVSTDGNTLMVAWPEEGGTTVITLVDATGRAVLQSTSLAARIVLPTAELATGAYTIVREANGKRWTKRFVLAR